MISLKAMLIAQIKLKGYLAGSLYFKVSEIEVYSFKFIKSFILLTL